MKKGKSILFLLLSLAMLLVVAAPLLIQLRILMLKEEAKEKLESTQLQVVRISAKDIRWTETGKEIRIGKRLFDIEKFRWDHDDLIATGMYDDEESALEIQMDKLWQQNDSKHALVLLKYFQLQMSYLQESSFTLAKFPALTKCYIVQINTYNEKVFIKIPYPPPQVNNHLSII